MVDWKSLVRHRLTPLGLTAAAEADLTDEIAQHLEDYCRELLSGGASEEEAYQKTVSELDDVYPLRASDRAQRMPRYDAVAAGAAGRGTSMDDLWRDLRYAARTMRQKPMFVLFVVVTLGLGIGANTTVFTLINTLILNPLPVQTPSELAAVAGDAVGLPQSGTPMLMSYPNLKDYQSRNDVFRSLAGYTSKRVVTWQTNGASQGFLSEFVTANYFSTLGLSVRAGRYFTSADDAPGSHPAAVLNYGTWQTRFGGAADVVGSQLRLNNVVVTVVGVAPRGFIGVNGIVGPDLWLPVSAAEQLLPNEMPVALADRSKALFNGVGRLKPGVTTPQAQANMTTLASALASEYPAANQDQTASVRPIRDLMFGGGSITILFASAVLVVVVGIVLLIACSNVANLLLARSAARQQEMAVRLALGASRRRLVRQLLTESICLGVLGGGVGLLVAYAGTQLFAGILPMSGTFVAPKLDLVVLLFTLVISLATGILFGLIPAFQASRASVAATLNEAARASGRSRKGVTLANVLLVGQVAFSFLLLVTAALFLRSIQRAYQIDPGFQTIHLAVFVLNPGQAGYGEPQTKAFYQEVRERVAALPGVASVSWASNMPLWARAVSGLQVEGRPQRSSADASTTIVNTVDRAYFETAGVTIARGRAFTEVDRQTSIAVAIVNEKLALDYWPGDDALGKRVQVPGEQQMRQVVGVARTANYSSWAEPPQRAVYVPLEQNHLPAMTLYVRTAGEPDQILVPVGREVAAVAPQVLLSATRTGRQIIDGGLFQARIGVTLLGMFGLLALGLASVGLYGILAYAVTQRKREIGLRMALGASQPSVLRLILGQGMSLVVIGVVIGLVAALMVGRLLSRMLFGVGAADPVSLIGSAVVLVGVALLACYLPARWATRVDPVVALREV